MTRSVTVAALAFATGAALLQVQAELPAPHWALVVPLLGVLAYRVPRAAPLAAFACGFAWAALLAHQRIGDWLDPALEGRTLEVVGVIASLPVATDRALRFEF